ncbi:hypothetical protein [Acrocarpospora corrugata]|nr:hypothetical protein [Acrocarpospora corrugata]
MGLEFGRRHRTEGDILPPPPVASPGSSLRRVTVVVPLLALAASCFSSPP